MKCDKIVVFDLDETIGHFVQLSNIMKTFEKVFLRPLKPHEKMFILNLFPEMFRPSIFNIFKYLVDIKQMKNNNIKVILFTNNQGQRTWQSFIIRYIHAILQYPLFDDIIGSHQISEHRRTSIEKKWEDLKKIVGCDLSTPAIFFDDRIHEKMNHSSMINVVVQPYRIRYSFGEIWKRIHNKVKIFHKVNPKFFKYLLEYNLNFYDDYLAHELSLQELDHMTTLDDIPYHDSNVQDTEWMLQVLKQFIERTFTTSSPSSTPIVSMLPPIKNTQSVFRKQEYTSEPHDFRTLQKREHKKTKLTPLLLT